MSRNYNIRDQEKLYLVTFTVVNWIEVFIRIEHDQIIFDMLNYCIENKGLEVCAWCMMTNHVHLIIGSKGDNKLEDIGRDIKRHTSKSLLKAIIDNPKESRKDWMLWLFEGAGKRNPNNKYHQLWQQHSHPSELFNNFIIER
jgi:putative transposase